MIYLKSKDVMNLVEENSQMEDYEGKLLIIKPEALKEEYRQLQFLYFIATSGFGCEPTSLGTAVFGFFLIDGDNARLRRADFLGIAKDQTIKREDIKND